MKRAAIYYVPEATEGFVTVVEKTLAIDSRPQKRDFLSHLLIGTVFSLLIRIRSKVT